MDEHFVRLPHPQREAETVGVCDCGWTVAYAFGRHGVAVDAGKEHINHAAGAEAIELPNYAGDRDLIPGRSL